MERKKQEEMRKKRFSTFILFVVMASIFMACSSGNDEIEQQKPEEETPIEGEDPTEGKEPTEGEEPIETVDVAEKDLIGHWRCFLQEWFEAGDEWQSSYDIAKDEYYVQFNENLTGTSDSGKDELMEISGKSNFTWSVSNGIITFGTSDTDKWYIKEFSESEMTLYWVDGAYNITCKFKRDLGGAYKPVLGEKIMRIINYYPQYDGGKSQVVIHDFEYDSQNRISKWTRTVTYGNGGIGSTEYSYVGNSITIDNKTYSIGENGYLMLNGCSHLPDIHYIDVTKLIYDDEGYLIDIEYGEKYSEKGTVHFIYDGGGYTSTLKSVYEEETSQYTYNFDFPNNTSINLPPFYIRRGSYFDYDLTLFDIIGKRCPYLPKEITFKSKKDNFHYEYAFQKDAKERLIQIKQTDNMHPEGNEIWEIYYEDTINDLPTDEPTEETGTIANAVDLGLSVKWASWNLGASSPEGYGALYAWGVPDAKPGYNGDTQRPDKFKYKEISGTEYDIARAKWGGKWRLPTYSEQHELATKCKWEICEINNIVGLKVTGPNNNSIFLPAAGYENSVNITQRGEKGYYWSGTRGSDQHSYYPHYRDFTLNESLLSLSWRDNAGYSSSLTAPNLNYCNAMSIRPVCD